MHFLALNVELTGLAQEQPSSAGVQVQDHFKGVHYRCSERADKRGCPTVRVHRHDREGHTPVVFIHCASCVFAFIDSINSDQSTSDVVSFSMTGRTCQDVSFVSSCRLVLDDVVFLCSFPLLFLTRPLSTHALKLGVFSWVVLTRIVRGTPWNAVARRFCYGYAFSIDALTFLRALPSPWADEGRWQWRSLRSLPLPSFFKPYTSPLVPSPQYSRSPLSSRPQPLGSGGDITPCEDTREDFGLLI